MLIWKLSILLMVGLLGSAGCAPIAALADYDDEGVYEEGPYGYHEGFYEDDEPVFEEEELSRYGDEGLFEDEYGYYGEDGYGLYEDEGVFGFEQYGYPRDEGIYEDEEGRVYEFDSDDDGY
jgi:hypothetical protein